QGGSQLIDFRIGLENRRHDFLLLAEALTAPGFRRVTLAHHQTDMPHTPTRNARSTAAFRSGRADHGRSLCSSVSSGSYARQRAAFRREQGFSSGPIPSLKDFAPCLAGDLRYSAGCSTRPTLRPPSASGI